jgi:hypothetical protein
MSPYPQVFYSHAWKFLFLEVVEAAQRYFKGSGDDPYIWFDVFSVSQHKSGVRPFEWWNGAFLNAVSTIGFVLMCMQPFEDPRTHTPPWTTLSRVWYVHFDFSVRHHPNLPATPNACFSPTACSLRCDTASSTDRMLT